MIKTQQGATPSAWVDRQLPSGSDLASSFGRETSRPRLPYQFEAGRVLIEDLAHRPKL